MNNIREKFQGDIIIVDDEVNTPDTDIFNIKSFLLSEKYTVIEYDTFPQESELLSRKIAFIICDWLFIKTNDDNNAEAVIKFLNKMQEHIFVPVFICSSIERNEIERYLLVEGKGCKKYKKNDASCIFIVKKSDIKGKKIYSFLDNWLIKNPSVKLLKEWEKSIETAKNKMFNDLYVESEYWPCVIAKNFTEDRVNPGNAIGEFLTKNLLSRISDYNISAIENNAHESVDLERVLDGERCFYYDSKEITKDTVFFTGDILLLGDKYYVNIKRQCDLNNIDNKNLYLLNVSKLDSIENSPISIDSDLSGIKVYDKHFNLSEDKAKTINKAMEKVFSKTRALHKGKILEINSEVIIPCVCCMKAAKIDLRSLEVEKLVVEQEDNISKFKRVARLLEPYITIVIEKFSAYTSSKGSMRTPEELFSGKFFINDDD